MKIIMSQAYKKIANKAFYEDFKVEDQHLDDPFIIQRNGIVYSVQAPYNAEGRIRKEYVTDFPGDLEREDNYISSSIEDISVSIGDVESVTDNLGNFIDPYEFQISWEEEQMMEQEVKEHYYNII